MEVRERHGWRRKQLLYDLRGNRGCYELKVEAIRGGDGKSLVRPGRKQATATKLGIYSTYSQRSAIQFFALCSNFWKPLKKKNQRLVRPTKSPRQQWPPRRKKNGDFSIVVSVQRTDGSPTAPDPENRVGDQDIGSPGRPVSSGLQVLSEPEHCRARTRHTWWPYSGILPSEIPSKHQQRWVINTPHW